MTTSSLRGACFALFIVVAIVIAACGGGTETLSHQNPFGAKPISLAQAPDRVRAFAAEANVEQAGTASPYGAASPADAIKQLLDHGEKSYSQYFPSHQETLVYEKYRYRYYENTGVYLGVATEVAPGDGLVEGGVYVMGGEFGDIPTYVGSITNFITPGPSFNPILLVQRDGIKAPDNGPLVAINLETNDQSGVMPFGTAIACKAGNLTVNSLARIFCSSGKNLWDYNPLTGKSTETVTLKLPVKSVAFGEVVSAPDGTDYYMLGNYNLGKILIRKGDIFTGEITIPEEPSGNFPKQMLFDQTTKNLFVMKWNSTGDRTPLSVVRVNLTTNQVDATITEDYLGHGIALHKGELYVAMTRNKQGMDVVKYDITTMKKVASGQVTVMSGSASNVYSVAVDDAGVHLGTINGIQTLSHDLGKVLRTTTFPDADGIQFIRSHQGKLYTVDPNTTTKQIRELESMTLEEKRSWSGLLYPQNISIIAR